MLNVLKACILIPFNLTVLFWCLVFHVTTIYPLTLTYDCLQLYFCAKPSQWYTFDAKQFVPRMHQLSNTFFLQSLIMFEHQCLDNVVLLMKDASTQNLLSIFSSQLEYFLSVITGGRYVIESSGTKISYSLVNVSAKSFELPYRVQNIPQGQLNRSRFELNELTNKEMYLSHMMMMCSKAVYEHYEVIMDLAEKWGCNQEAWQISYKHRRGPNGEKVCPETKVCIFPFPDMIVVAFCGTEPLNLLMWYTDFSVDTIGEDQGVPAAMGRVHEGFYTALTFVPPENNSKCIFDVVHDKVKSLNKKNLPIYVCGHSLGAACASMFSALCAAKPPELKLTFASEQIKGVYTFGQPRVGNIDYCRFVETHYRGKFYRFANATDIVPKGPMGDYVHHGKGYLIDSHKQIKDRSDDTSRTRLREILGMFFWYTPYKIIMGQKIYGETKLRLFQRFTMPPFFNDHFTSDYELGLAVNCEMIKQAVENSQAKSSITTARTAGDDF